MLLFGETKKGYGLSVSKCEDGIEVIMRKGHSNARIVLDIKDAKKLARNIYILCRESE